MNPHFARKMSEDLAAVVKDYSEKSIGEILRHYAFQVCLNLSAHGYRYVSN